MGDIIQFPQQQLPFSRKTKKWRKQILDWASNKSYFNYSPVRKSVNGMVINQHLINGTLHMDDLKLFLNPSQIDANYIPEQIIHYPIINSKINVLKGEESKRVFDWRVIVTNPNAISEIEENKKNALFQKLQEAVQNKSQSEEDFNAELERIDYFFQYEWQDIREIRGNALLTHYVKEYNIPKIFNDGFQDGIVFGEEIYQVDIRGGEPILEKLNPMKVRVFKSGYSSRVEDADMVILEDYWSPGKIIDVYYDQLSATDIKYIEELPSQIDNGSYDSMDNYDDRAGQVHTSQVSVDGENFYSDLFGDSNLTNDLMPYDTLGNIRVTRVYWKSRRKIKKIKSYDPETGETVYNLYPETYILNEELGEEEQVFWINEAWEGTKIGERIYVQMRPRIIQYNRLSNPSRCHFGIIGSVYNMNDEKPFSLVDMMKPYSYYYDAVHDRLNKLIEKNKGKMMVLDLAKVPKGWTMDKWLYYAQLMNVAVIDSFKEGSMGAATGKLAGGMNNASSGVIDMELASSIQATINILEYIKGEMSEVAGISKQREGQISNRETVGGVERATLQSSHITEWLFTIHDDVKKRVLEAFLETAKIALRGRSKKFQYILGEGVIKIVDIDGDEFAECDYGLVIDNSNELQQLSQKLDMLTQAAIQNQYSMSTIMKLFTSTSFMEKIRMLEREEQTKQQQSQQVQQQEMQIQQQMIQQKVQSEQAKMEQDYKMNSENNQTKILVAEINSKAEADRLAMMNQDDGIQEMSEVDRAKLSEQIRQFDQTLQLQKDKLTLEKEKAQKDQELKRQQINKQKNK